MDIGLESDIFELITQMFFTKSNDMNMSHRKTDDADVFRDCLINLPNVVNSIVNAECIFIDYVLYKSRISIINDNIIGKHGNRETTLDGNRVDI